MRFDGLLFDIDGTLWDSCAAVCDSWRSSLLRRYSRTDSPDILQVRSIMGMTPDKISAKLFGDFGDRAREVFDVLSADECGYLASHGADIYAGVEDTLRDLAGEYRLFIVSNCQVGYIEAFLQATGLGNCFEDYLCAGSTGLGKSENICSLMRRRALGRALYVGDTLADELAARDAQCAFIYAAYGFGAAAAPDAVIHRFGELPAVIKGLEG